MHWKLHMNSTCKLANSQTLTAYVRGASLLAYPRASPASFKIRLFLTRRGNASSSVRFRLKESHEDEMECCTLADEVPESLNLYDLLLNRATSSIKRGTCTCLKCRGVGTEACSECQVKYIYFHFRQITGISTDHGMTINGC